MKNKIITMCLCVLMLTLSSCNGSEVSEQSSEIVVTNEAGVKIFRDRLTIHEYRLYLVWYKINIRTSIILLDFDSEITPEATKETEMVVRLLNYLVWDHHFEAINPGDEDLTNDQLEARKTMEEYGFSKEIPVTSEWVMNNTYDAYQMMSLLPDLIRYYCTHDPEDGCEYYEIDMSDTNGKSFRTPPFHP